MAEAERGGNAGLGGLWLSGLFALALTARLAMALAYPAYAGDSPGYLVLAENIYRNGCVAASPPEGAACLPEPGGSRLPGYPAVLALAWLLFGPSTVSALLLPCLLQALAIAWLAEAATRAAGSRAAGLAAGLLCALSPLQVPYARFVLTEALQTAAAWWVFAEMLRCLALGRLAILPLALALGAALTLRYDALLLCLPVTALGLLLHRPREALRRGAILAVLLALLPGAWALRNLAHGIPALPRGDVASLPGYPLGYYRWGMSWTVSHYDGQAWAYPIGERRWSDIVVPERAYVSADERRQVATLLEALRRHDGKPVPAEIDAAFQSLYEARKRAAPWRHYLFDPLRAIWDLAANPVTANGWPTPAGDIGPERRLGGLMSLALAFPGDLAIRAGGNLYRYALLLGALALLLWPVPLPRAVRWALALALGYFLLRLAVFGYGNRPVTRYLLPGYAFLEPALGLALVSARRVLPGRKAASQIGT